MTIINLEDTLLLVGICSQDCIKIPRRLFKYNGDIFAGEREVGPWFGIHDLYFYGTMKDCYTYKFSGQCLYLDGNGLAEQTNIDNSVPVKEVEVYQIIFKY